MGQTKCDRGHYICLINYVSYKAAIPAFLAGSLKHSLKSSVEKKNMGFFGKEEKVHCPFVFIAYSKPHLALMQLFIYSCN